MDDATVADLNLQCSSFSRQIITHCVHERLLVAEARETGPYSGVQPVIVYGFGPGICFEFQFRAEASAARKAHIFGSVQGGTCNNQCILKPSCPLIVP